MWTADGERGAVVSRSSPPLTDGEDRAPQDTFADASVYRHSPLLWCLRQRDVPFGRVGADGDRATDALERQVPVAAEWKSHRFSKLIPSDDVDAVSSLVLFACERFQGRRVRLTAEFVIDEREPMRNAECDLPSHVVSSGASQPVDEAGLAVAVAEERRRVVGVAESEPTPTVRAERAFAVAADGVRHVVEHVVVPDRRDHHVLTVDLEDLRAFPQGTGPDGVCGCSRPLGGEAIEVPVQAVLG